VPYFYASKQVQSFFLFSLVTLIFFAASFAQAGPPPPTPSSQLVNLSADNEPLRHLLMRIGAQSHTNIIISGNVRGRTTLALTNVTVEQALSAVLEPFNLTFKRYGSIIIIASSENRNPRPAPTATPTVAMAVLSVTIITADRAGATLHRLYPKAHISIDHAANAVIVTASAEDVQAMRALLQGIDVKNPTTATVEAVQVRYPNQLTS